ncbi:hypothetical protein [Mesorhizobium sp. LNJC384A00]|uniref:hypothetical protein n=1 Tax=Mesorhizobium sp. LNJC384A00 TaxID=1287268 RepID=UPI0018DB6739|nr:hypothetical protein [Mesorhizobium sp. LNJC384A00]
MPQRHAVCANDALVFLLACESGALAFGHRPFRIVEQRIVQAWFHHPAGAQVDLAIHGFMHACAIRRRVRRHFIFGLRDPRVEAATRQLGVERVLLVLHLLVAFGKSGKVVAETLHGAADRRPLGILHGVAGIEPALADGKGDDVYHLRVPRPRGPEGRTAEDHGAARHSGGRSA